MIARVGRDMNLAKLERTDLPEYVCPADENIVVFEVVVLSLKKLIIMALSWSLCANRISNSRGYVWA